MIDTRKFVYPYPTLETGPKLTVAKVSIDGRPAVGALDAALHTIDFRVTPNPDWHDASIEIDAAIARQTLEDFEIAHAVQVQAVAQVFCRTTNVRDVFELKRDEEEPRWHGRVDLPASAYLGDAQLTVLLTASVHDVPNRIVAGSETWNIIFDESAPSVISGRITSKWRHFAKDEEGLVAYKDLPFFLDASGNEPVIYLNEDFPDLHALLKDGQRRPPDAAALNEMTLVTIAQGCWMGLFNAAVMEIKQPDEGQDYTLPSSWRGELIAYVASKLYPDTPKGDQLKLLYDEQRNSAGTLQADVLRVATEAINFSNKLRKHIQRLSEGDKA